MRDFSIAPLETVASLWRNRGLVHLLTVREVIGRYKGSMMGILWSLFNPLFMLAIYTFVFSVIFKMKWGTGGEESKADFAIILFVGLIIHGLFAECVNRAPVLILSNVNYVKKVVFPLEILPWVAFGSALFHAAISFLVLILGKLMLSHQVPWTAVLLPLVLLPLVFVTMGIAWLLAALGVYLRDISQLTGMLTTLMLFASPVMYPLSAVPERWRFWFELNPLTFAIEEGRNALIYGHVPSVGRWLVMIVGGLLAAWLGFAWFQKSRRGFSDVL